MNEVIVIGERFWPYGTPDCGVMSFSLLIATVPAPDGTEAAI